jgi:hypothetical protein
MFSRGVFGPIGTVFTLLFLGIVSWPHSYAQITGTQLANAASPPAAAARHPSGDTTKLKQDETRLLAILVRDPDNVGALAGMAWVRSRQKNYLAAISYLEPATQKHPDDKALSVALDLDRYRFIEGEADYALSSGDLASARKFYTLAIQIRPYCREASTGLRSTLLRQQQILVAGQSNPLDR